MMFGAYREGKEQLPRVMHISVARYNRDLPKKIDVMTLIRVPDPGFASLLAVHFGALLVADDSLIDERGSLLRTLVPVAANDPTALDTVLSYLLISNQPDDVELLEEIAKETGPVVFTDTTPPPSQIGPDAVPPD